MIMAALIATWIFRPAKLKKSTCFRSKIGERMSGPSGMGKPAFMPASVRNQQVQQVYQCMILRVKELAKSMLQPNVNAKG